ncbi:MAG: SH3 domain-containing protein [Treponema sp.]|nr:SH3 domain-containing protein [Treponema sp.]
MPLEEELLRSETTSWGKVQTTAGAVVLDLENPEKYFSYSSMYDYYRAQIQEVKKDGDLYTLIIDNNDPPVYYKIRFLEFDKIKFLENEYLSPEYYRVTSPRSADSESDNPPLDMSNYSTTHRTLDNLRLRDAANTSSRLVTTLPKDTEIQVIETGSSTTIDGITAPWVKIISSTGYTGWCFSGYLEEVKKPELVQERIATSV